MLSLPSHLYLTFFSATFLCIYFFLKASSYNKTSLFLLFLWLILQGLLAYNNFYSQLGDGFPKPLLMVVPVLLFIGILFLSHSGKQYIDRLDISLLCLIHIIRIPIEIILHELYLNKAVPLLMTYEGRNFDIISGLSAPFIYYFGFIKQRLSTKTLLIWNYVCLALLLNIVVNAILSLPLPFQQFAFDQPNKAVLYFPFVWLPSLIVPLVLFSHLSSIRQLQAKLYS